jgi:hypothetical protein
MRIASTSSAWCCSATRARASATSPRAPAEAFRWRCSRHAGKLLPLTRFGKDDAEITQGTIVSNKLLAGALQFIKDKQAAKDVEKLSKLRTKRDRRLLEKRKKRVA